MQSIETKVTPSGGIIIPEEMIRKLGLKAGDEVVVRLVDDHLQVFTREAAIKKAQAVIREYVKEGESLADELILERRRHADDA